MFHWLKKFLSSPKPTETEVEFLRAQVRTLQATVDRLTTKPASAISSPETWRPRKYDPESKTFIPKTDEEIQADLQGMRELGIL